MPAIICYVSSAAGGEVQFRVRFGRRVAIPVSDMPEPPKRLLLSCSGFTASGFTAELKLSGVFNGFAVYYITSADFDMLIDLIYRLCSYEPCRLPCTLSTTFQPSADPAPT
jgi:hypothetical protein